MFWAREEEHEGEGAEHAEDVEEGEADQEWRLDGQEVATVGAGVDQLPALPQGPAPGRGQTQAGGCWPGGGGLDRRGAGGGQQGEEVEQVGDAWHQTEHTWHQRDQESKDLKLK